MHFNRKVLGAVAVIGTLTACNSTPEEVVETKPTGFEVSSLNTDVDPCHDFFEYSTGGWVEANPIPETESRWGRFNMLIESNNEKLKVILDELTQATDLKPGTYQQLVGDLYASGMDSAAINELDKGPLQPFIDQLNNTATIKELDDIWAGYGLVGIDKPFGGGVYADQMNSSVNTFYMGQSGIGLPDRDYYFPAEDDERGQMILAKYRQHIVNQLMNFGRSNEDAELVADRVMKVETQLAENMLTRVERRDPYKTYNKMGAQEVAALMSNFDFSEFSNLSHFVIDTLVVSSPEYLKALNELIVTIPMENWQAYNTWKLINSLAPYMSERFEEENFDFYSRTLRGTKEMKPRWRRVLSSMGGLNEQIGHLFVDKHFSPESKVAVEGMVEDLREAYRMRINELTWMSDDTKVKAMEKLDAFTYKIGYPNEWKNYTDLKIKKQGYLGNIISLRTYKRRENLAKYRTKVDKNEWLMGAHVVNAYYNPLNNEVVFPAGILQPPFYNPEADDAINYGAIGGVIGHEFTHGFDDKGSLYDAKGNLNNWWTSEDSTNFAGLVQQVKDQYSAYEPLPGVFVNGDLTVGENIADFGGLTLGYYAYKMSHEGEAAESIDGFTPEQRIFLGWAQVWQTSQTDEFLANQVKTDSHSPAMYRVNGPMSNMVEFEEAFGCDHDSSMMRDNKIVIW